MSFISRNKEKLKRIAFKVFSDVQQCCCSVFVDCMLHWGCVYFCCWLVGCARFFWFILIFCLSTCCVHLMETAEGCVFLGGGGYLYISVRLTQTKSSNSSVLDPASVLLVLKLVSA